jgi:2-(3-amino-3-carboxypropyl)histidine synthase
MYDFNLDEVSDWIALRGAKRVAVQLPEGLKLYALDIMNDLEERTGADILLVADPCYGACDFPTDFRRFAEALVQFGHAEMSSLRVPDDVFFVEVYADVDPLPLMEEALGRLGEKVGLITTVQHIKLLPIIKQWLEENGKIVMIDEGDDRVAHPGQVLGCNVTPASSLAAKVDNFLYIGSGDFHPLAVSIETSKPVIVVDPLNREVRDVRDLTDRVLRQRHGAIVLGSEAKTFAILICTKPGQMRLAVARSLREKLQSKGRNGFLVAMDRFDPDSLIALKVDAYVSTACPRLAIDDYLRYKKPILTPVELEIAIGLREWNEYRFDSILG